MKRLIKGQTIRIDNHDSGSGREITYDDSLHIHKVMNSDRYNGVEVLIPLNENREISFRKVKGKNGLIKSRLRNEINRAFRSPQKRKQFASDIFKDIERYSQNEDNPIRIQNLVKSAKAIAKHFDLYPEIRNEVSNRIKDRISTYYSEHIDENGERYFIYQDLKGQNIRIGSDFNILEDWEETKRIFDIE